jgi:hypothetical protein
MPAQTSPTAARIPAVVEGIPMAEDHQLSIMIEPDPERPERCRWVLVRAGVVKARSLDTYATKWEAQAEAATTLAKQIAACGR